MYFAKLMTPCPELVPRDQLEKGSRLSVCVLTLLLSHLLQTEVDDSGSEAESNQGDRSSALRGKQDTGVWRGYSKFKHVSLFSWTANSSALACVHITVPTL